MHLVISSSRFLHYLTAKSTLPWRLEHIFCNDGFGIVHSQVGKLIAPLVNLW
jgi:hypothetical protein